MSDKGSHLRRKKLLTFGHCPNSEAWIQPEVIFFILSCFGFLLENTLGKGVGWNYSKSFGGSLEVVLKKILVQWEALSKFSWEEDKIDTRIPGGRIAGYRQTSQLLDQWKSRIREKLNLSTDADISTNTKTDKLTDFKKWGGSKGGQCFWVSFFFSSSFFVSG